MKKVMAFGTFDVFHQGHQYYLQQSKSLGDQLVVVVALDQTVFEVKGFSPQDNQELRLQNVATSGLCDLAVLGNPENKFKVLEEHKPDIIALGYDQVAFTQNLEQAIIDLGLSTKIIRIESYKPEIYKSSYLKNKN